MAILVVVGVLVLFVATFVVADGIHIRTVAPAQRRNAWWTLGYHSVVLAGSLVFWWVLLDLASLDILPAPPGWALGFCILPLLIVLGCFSFGYLRSKLRQVAQRGSKSLFCRKVTY